VLVDVVVGVVVVVEVLVDVVVGVVVVVDVLVVVVVMQLLLMQSSFAAQLARVVVICVPYVPAQFAQSSQLSRVQFGPLQVDWYCMTTTTRQSCHTHQA